MYFQEVVLKKWRKLVYDSICVSFGNAFTFSFISSTSTPSSIGEYSSIMVFIRDSNSSADRSSSLPVLIIFCSTYNPAALPLATSALIAADHAPLALDSSLSLANSDICLS